MTAGIATEDGRRVAPAIAALALGAVAMGASVLAIALGMLPATFSSLVIFLEAIVAAAFGWVLLNEPLGILQTLGGVLILFGIWIARPRTGRIEAGP